MEKKCYCLWGAQVKGTEDVAIHIEPSKISVSPEGLLGMGTGRTAEGADSDGWGSAGSLVEGAYWLKMAVTNSVPLHSLRKILNLFKVQKSSRQNTFKI